MCRHTSLPFKFQRPMLCSDSCWLLPQTQSMSSLMRSEHRPVTLFLFLLFSWCTNSVSAVGVNWGLASSTPLPPSKVVNGLLLSNGVTRVKLPDADPTVLESLSGSGIEVIVGIRNEMLRYLSQSKKAAASWVHDNVTRYYSDNRAGGGVQIE